MNYSIEKTINDLKLARKNKQFSQRELSAKTGIAQSHISKIENGAMDITLSTLVELARALDLEVTLIPRKNIPAVQSITRASIKPNTSAWKELKDINKNIKSLQKNTALSNEIKRIKNDLKVLNNIHIPNEFFSEVKKISDALKNVRINQNAIEDIQKTTNAIQKLRNNIMHHLPEEESKPKPAYSLDNIENG